METTEQTEDFKPSKITIKVKLIGIISAIIIFALSLMIFLASAFFRNDSEKRIQENTLKLTEVIGQRVESELSSVFHNLRINA
ncbi:MAG: adenylate/guanylate cyclase domain-containing protein, partial [Leptospiraceae bacterium]|nr:adenylate/guanylate cyclase domain-containing protein [Leptospiraceae bacterium]